MKWREMRKALSKKMFAEQERGTKHDFWYVKCDDLLIGKVKDSRGDGE